MEAWPSMAEVEQSLFNRWEHTVGNETTPKMVKASELDPAEVLGKRVHLYLEGRVAGVDDYSKEDGAGHVTFVYVVLDNGDTVEVPSDEVTMALEVVDLDLTDRPAEWPPEPVDPREAAVANTWQGPPRLEFPSLPPEEQSTGEPQAQAHNHDGHGWHWHTADQAHVPADQATEEFGPDTPQYASVVGMADYQRTLDHEAGSPQ